MAPRSITVGSTLYFMRDGAWREGVVDEVCVLRNHVTRKDETWVKLYAAGADRSTLIEPTKLFRAPRRELGTTR